MIHYYPKPTSHRGLTTHIAGADTIFSSTGTSAAVGIIFGLYPAVRAAHAAQLDPIVALRIE